MMEKHKCPEGEWVLYEWWFSWQLAWAVFAFLTVGGFIWTWFYITWYDKISTMLLIMMFGLVIGSIIGITNEAPHTKYYKWEMKDKEK